MDLLDRIQWNITDQYLNDATIDGRQLTKEELRALQSPIQLTTPRLVLNLRPSRYEGVVPVTFETGSEVTPLLILGAIHTYYSLHHDKMEDLRLVHGIEQYLDGSLTPEMEPETLVVLPHVRIADAPGGPVGTARTLRPTYAGNVPLEPTATQGPPVGPPGAELSPHQRFGLTHQPYSEKSLVVRGNLDYYDEITSVMERLGGKYNAYLKGGPGWIFPKFKREELEHYFATGRHYLPR